MDMNERWNEGENYSKEWYMINIEGSSYLFAWVIFWVLQLRVHPAYDILLESLANIVHILSNTIENNALYIDKEVVILRIHFKLMK